MHNMSFQLLEGAGNLNCIFKKALDGIFEGWLFNVSNPSRRYEIEVIVNGSIAATVSADIYKESKDTVGEKNQNCGFYLDLRYFLKPNHIAQVNFRVKNKGVYLFKENFSFEWKDDRSVVGHLENFSDEFVVSGWAYSLSEEKPAIIDVFLNGDLIATGLADGFRPDVQMHVRDRLRCGFKIKLPPQAVKDFSGHIHILVNGCPIANGVLRFSLLGKASLELGEIKAAKLKISLTGVYIRECVVDIFVDGIFCEKIKVCYAEDYLLNGEWLIPNHLRDGSRHVIQGFVNGLGQLRSDIKNIKYPDFAIHIDKVGKSSIAGWVFQKDSDFPVAVDCYHNDILIGSFFANEIRDDVKFSHQLVSSRHGFTFEIDDELSGSSKLYFEDAATNVAIAEIHISDRFEDLQEAVRLGFGVDNKAGVFKSLLADSLTSEKGGFDYRLVDPTPKSIQSSDILTVILPIYDGYIETVECLDSLLTAKNTVKHRLIVINDNSPNVEINRYLEEVDFGIFGNAVYIKRTRNGGFSEAVNAGYSIAGRSDVVIVNADAVIQDNWLDKLVHIAESEPNIATVTPFTNNGEVATYPYICKSLAVSHLDLAKEVNAAAERRNLRKFVEIPVAIGFCMYIKRACLDQIGYFDAAKWGRGYGEEVEFCIKALSFGWKHVLAVDSFAIHRGNVSFGNEKLERIIKSSKIISNDYPYYDSYVQRYISDDPARVYRRNISVDLLSKDISQNSALIISHAFGGGTKKYVDDICRLYKNSGYSISLLEVGGDRCYRMHLHTNQSKWNGFFQNVHVEIYKSTESEKLLEDLRILNFDKVHLNSPFGLNADILKWIIEKNYILTLHDYAWVCPWVTMQGLDGNFQEKISAEDIDLHQPHKLLISFYNDAKESGKEYSSSFVDLFRSAKKIICASDDTKRRMEAHGLLGQYIVKDHPLVKSPIKSNLRKTTTGHEINVGIIGAISDIKGYWQLLDLATTAKRLNMPLKFTVFGYTQDDKAFDGLSNVEILGLYNEDDIGDLTSGYGVDLALFPYQIAETYSYTLSLCFELGIWPLVTDIGAPAERVRKLSYGTTYPVDTNSTQLCRLLINVANAHNKEKGQGPSFTVCENISDYIEGKLF